MTRTHTVLIADDEQTIARLYGGIMVRLGFDIVLAATGQEALDKAPLVRPSLILTDINMPELSGPDFLRHLKQTRTPPCPAVLISADDGIDILGYGLDAGADDFMVKGAEVKAIESCARFWIGSGLTGLPDLARHKALSLMQETSLEWSSSTLDSLDRETLSAILSAIAPEIAAMPQGFGIRLVERTLLIARLSGLILECAHDARQALRFPYLLLTALNRLNQPWVRDSYLLLRRFETMAADPLFQQAYKEGLNVLELQA